MRTGSAEQAIDDFVQRAQASLSSEVLEDEAPCALERDRAFEAPAPPPMTRATFVGALLAVASVSAAVAIVSARLGAIPSLAPPINAAMDRPQPPAPAFLHPGKPSARASASASASASLRASAALRASAPVWDPLESTCRHASLSIL